MIVMILVTPNGFVLKVVGVGHHGCVVVGGNRMAQFYAGIPYSVPISTVNRQVIINQELTLALRRGTDTIYHHS